MLEVLSKPGARDPEYVLAAVAEAVTGVKAADREKQRAATIGTAVHAGIEWQLRTALGEDPGPEPHLPDAAAWAVESWKDWAAKVALEPLAIERTVYCLECGYRDARSLRAGRRDPDGARLEDGPGDLSRSPPPERGLPARRPALGHAVQSGVDRALAETP